MKDERGDEEATRVDVRLEEKKTRYLYFCSCTVVDQSSDLLHRHRPHRPHADVICMHMMLATATATCPMMRPSGERQAAPNDAI